MREDDFRPVYCFKFIKVNTTDCHKSRCQYEILTIEYEIGKMKRKAYKTRGRDGGCRVEDAKRSSRRGTALEMSTSEGQLVLDDVETELESQG